MSDATPEQPLAQPDCKVETSRFTWVELGDGKKYKCPWVGFGPTSARIEDAWDTFRRPADKGEKTSAEYRTQVRDFFMAVFSVHYTPETVQRLLDADLIGLEHISQVKRIVFCLDTDSDT
jgi:hypothetical protein